MYEYRVISLSEILCAQYRLSIFSNQRLPFSNSESLFVFFVFFFGVSEGVSEGMSE